MNQYYLMHSALFPNFNTVNPDGCGFFLIENELGRSDSKAVPKATLDLAFFVFNLSDGGEMDVVKDEINLGPESMNTFKLLTVLELCPNKVTYEALSKEARKREGITSLPRFLQSRIASRNLLMERQHPESFDGSAPVPELIGAKFKHSEIIALLIEARQDSVYINCRDTRFPTGLRQSKSESRGKGLFGQNCNVNACQVPASAFFYNTAMRAYYCLHCAEQIHKANRGQYETHGPLFDADLLFKARRDKSLPLVDLRNQREKLNNLREQVRGY